MNAKIPDTFDHDAAIALGKLVEGVLSNPGGRSAFRDNPDKAATDRTVDISAVPRPLVEALARLTDEQLEILIDLNETFTGEGMHLDVSNPNFRALMVL